MPIDQQLLDILACPQCKGALSPVDGHGALLCSHCQIKYPVRDSIPVMIVEEALNSKTGVRSADTNAVKFSRAAFRVTGGPDLKMVFHLDEGSCRAIGRGNLDPNKTSVFNVDLTLALDEATKRLVQQYVAKQFKKQTTSFGTQGDRLGEFRRAPDLVLTDSSLSRLHAMIFYHESGVAVLDLVSKNGTFVNGNEVESHILKNGDVIELGETSILFEG